MDNFNYKKYLAESKLFEEMSFDDDIENKTNKNDFAFWYRSGARGKAQALKAKDLLTKNGIDADYSKGPFYISFSNAGVEERVVQQMLRDANLDRFVIMRDDKDLAEGKLLKEDLQIDNLFGEYVAQWSQGNYDYDFADLKPGSVKGSLVDDFTLGPDEYDDDDYVRDYKMMKDYLLKKRSYKLSQDEQEGLSQFPVQFSLEDNGETIKADIYYSPEYLAMVDADLDEGKLKENDKNDYANSEEDYTDEMVIEKIKDIIRYHELDPSDVLEEIGQEFGIAFEFGRG